MSFRKEKKFALSYSDLQEIKKKMFNLGMEKLFPSRIINNCYFDTKNLNIFFDSEEGVLPRKKIRVRWYEKKLEFKKEVKVSSIEGRYKYDDLLTSIKSIDDIKKLFPVEEPLIKKLVDDKASFVILKPPIEPSLAVTLPLIITLPLLSK